MSPDGFHVSDLIETTLPGVQQLQDVGAATLGQWLAQAPGRPTALTAPVDPSTLPQPPKRSFPQP